MKNKENAIRKSIEASKKAKADKASEDALPAVQRIAYRSLSFAGSVLIELLEQAKDMNFIYFYGESRYGLSVRAHRYEQEAFLERRQEYMRKQAVRRLRAKRLISERRMGGKIVTRLTADGAIEALGHAIRASIEPLPDGHICLVSFDFPENAKLARNIFRRFLKRTGFCFVQGSVWMKKNNVIFLMKELVRLSGLNRWVKIYMAKE